VLGVGVGVGCLGCGGWGGGGSFVALRVCLPFRSGVGSGGLVVSLYDTHEAEPLGRNSYVPDQAADLIPHHQFLFVLWPWCSKTVGLGARQGQVYINLDDVYITYRHGEECK
jgi:hypothetical protein